MAVAIVPKNIPAKNPMTYISGAGFDKLAPVRISSPIRNSLVIVPLFLRKLVLGILAQASGKNHAATNASGGPGRPASFVVYPTRGRQ
ncbi:MAG: hypothetical protein ACXWF8_19280, partial [Methylobacter sp.]